MSKPITANQEARDHLRKAKRFILIAEGPDGQTRMFTGGHKFYEPILTALGFAIVKIKKEMGLVPTSEPVPAYEPTGGVPFEPDEAPDNPAPPVPETLETPEVFSIATRQPLEATPG